ncbi:MAG TPA: CheR family methyltransferase, partial [Myxococcus sp.]|nr:CheR family methyltransferase [Myxococcus sp.]
EPYSLAMVLVEQGALPIEVDLWATDLNLAAVDAARQGRFSSRRCLGIGQERLQRFFRPVEDGYEALPRLRDYIRFDGQNLAVPVFDKVRLSSLDLILCRNVIIYFDLPTIRGLMDRFLAALRPGGLLFLGYSESLFKVYDRFEMIEVDGAFVYRRPLLDKGASHGLPPRIAPYAQGPGEPPAEKKPDSPEAFAMELRKRIQAQGSAAGRISSTPPPTTPLPPLGTPPPVGPQVSSPQGAGPRPVPRARTMELPAVAAPEAARARITLELPAVAPSARTTTGEVPAWPKLLPPAERLAAAVQKMTQGDFPAAIAGVQRLLADEPSDLDALLTLGNLYSLVGRIPQAREVFAQALQREPLCVEARVFGGVAALQEGNLQEARSELAKALFLEPTLAIGHYLLAQVHERTHDFEAARRSYRNAIAQLRFPQRPLAGHYPDIPDSADAVARAARYALAALEEQPPR